MRHGSIGLRLGAGMFIGTRAGLALRDAPHLDFIIDIAVVGCLSLITMAWALRNRRRAMRAMALGLVTCLGFAVAGDHALRDDPTTLRVGPDAEPVLVHVRARLLDRFMPQTEPSGDLLDAFVHPRGDLPWMATASVLQIQDGSEWIDSRAVVRIVCGQTPDDLNPGSMILMHGWLGPLGPGHIADRPRAVPWACDRAVAVIRCEVPPRIERSPDAIQTMLHQARGWLDGNLLECLGHQTHERHRSLVVAMTTGRLLPGMEAIRERFRKAGLSHFLAISGFNVAVLFVMARWFMEWVGVPWVVRGLVLILLGAVFLLMVEMGVSVLRAGMTGSLLGLALLLRRGWNASGVLGVVAIITLWIDPCEAMNPGFQLSFGAVLGLLHGTQHVECALGGLVTTPQDAWWKRWIVGMRAAIAASLAAWLVSIPITLHHSGSMHPWCPLVSTVLGPCAALLTVIASMASIAGSLPGMESLLGMPLRWLALGMDKGVHASLWLPLRSLDVAPIPWWWASLGLCALALWWCTRWGRLIRIGGLLVSVLFWLLGAMWIRDQVSPASCPDSSELSWVMLDLGETHAHLISCDGVHTLVDGGSWSSRSVGTRRIIPMLHALGVKSIDRMVIRRATIDRFSGLPEVLESVPVGQVMLASTWNRSWDRDSAQDLFLRLVRQTRTPCRILDRESAWEQGSLSWRCLTPNASLSNSNPAPMIVIQHAGWSDAPCVVLPGACTDTAIERWMQRVHLARALAIEWPPIGHESDLRRRILADLQPMHVLVTSRGVMRPWPLAVAPTMCGSVHLDGCLRFTARFSPLESRLQRWSSRGWCQLTR